MDLTQAQQHISNFFQLTALINHHYHQFIVKIVSDVHLVLDNAKIKQLAIKYQTTPELIDQLIRIKAVGHDQGKYNEFGYNRAKDYQVDYMRDLETLYEGLFMNHEMYYLKDYQKLKTVNINENYQLLFIDQTQTWKTGLIINKNNQIALFLNASPFTQKALRILKNTGNITFYNFEHFGIIAGNNRKAIKFIGKWLVVDIFLTIIFLLIPNFLKQDYSTPASKVATIIYLAILLGPILIAGLIQLSYQPDTRVEPQTGLLITVDYAKNDPDCLVHSYRTHDYKTKSFFHYFFYY